MDHRLIAHLRWRAQAAMRTLGWPGVVGLGLLAFCLAFYWSALLPAKTRLAEMQEQAGSLGARLAHMKTQPQLVTPETQLAAFYRIFPDFAATPDLLEKLYAAAEASGIVLEQGEYRVVPGKEDKLDRYQVTLPVRGTYPAVRKFLGRVLADLPAASLDSVSFQRQKVGDMTVESQIKLTLYLGSNT